MKELQRILSADWWNGVGAIGDILATFLATFLAAAYKDDFRSLVEKLNSRKSAAPTLVLRRLPAKLSGETLTQKLIPRKSLPALILHALPAPLTVGFYVYSPVDALSGLLYMAFVALVFSFVCDCGFAVRNEGDEGYGGLRDFRTHSICWPFGQMLMIVEYDVVNYLLAAPAIA